MDREWELPLHPTDFRAGSIYEHYALALRWIAEASIPVADLYAPVSPENVQQAYQDLLHARVAPTERATVISVQSLALQAAGALGSVCFGALATARGAAFAFGTAGVALAAAACVVARIKVTDPAPDQIDTPEVSVLA